MPLAQIQATNINFFNQRFEKIPMKISKFFLTVMLVVLTTWIATGHAQEKPLTPESSLSIENMTDGEIKNLDMPGMTMGFQIRDAVLLEKFKAGDKVKFFAEKLDGAFVVTSMQLTK